MLQLPPLPSRTVRRPAHQAREVHGLHYALQYEPDHERARQADWLRTVSGERQDTMICRQAQADVGAPMSGCSEQHIPDRE